MYASLPSIRPPFVRGTLTQSERGSQSGCHLLSRDLAVVVDIQGIEDLVGPGPLLARDEAIAIQVIDALDINDDGQIFRSFWGNVEKGRQLCSRAFVVLTYSVCTLRALTALRPGWTGLFEHPALQLVFCVFHVA